MLHPDVDPSFHSFTWQRSLLYCYRHENYKRFRISSVVFDCLWDSFSNRFLRRASGYGAGSQRCASDQASDHGV